MILEKLLRLKVSSRDELISHIRSVLGENLKDVLDTHNTASIIFVYAHNGSQLLLKAEFGSDTPTHKEIGWYKLVQTKHMNKSPRFLDAHTGKTYALLLLEYIYGAKTIDSLVSNGQLASEEITIYLREALIVDHELFEETSTEASTHQTDLLKRKYHQRHAESEVVPYLSRLFSRKTVFINEKEYITPDTAMRKIETTLSLAKLLTPRKLGIIHGDLHCGNILTRDKGIFLIDPNGGSLMPIEYDIGKILHSIHGLYGSVMRNKYALTEEEFAPTYSFRFSIEEVAVYHAALAKLKQQLSDDEFLRGVYAEAIHFATMLPHHARAEKETTALFLQSTIIFNELLSLLL